VTDAVARSGSRRRFNVFYGWWITFAGAGLNLLQSALLGNAYGSYVVLLRDDFGWSKTALSAASSMREAESGIMSPFQGWLLDRLGPRWVSRVGVLISGCGFMLFSQVNSLLTFYGAFVVMAIGGSLCGFLTNTFAVVQWFERRRSTALALTSTGFALGGMVVPLVVVALEVFGWRGTAFLSGIVVICVGLPLSQLLRGSPAEMGLAPDGEPLDKALVDDAAASGQTYRPAIAATDFTLREALRTPAFWFIAGGHGSALFVVSAMSVHLVSHLTESQGYSLGRANAIVFFMTLIFLIGTVSGGFLGDRVNKRLLLVTCMGMHGLGIVLLSHATHFWMIVAFCLLHGLAWGWRGPQMTAIRADYFGRSSFGKIMGISQTIIIIGTIAGPLIAGFLYDQTGNYRIGFDILAGMTAAGAIFFILARRPTPPDRTAAAVSA